MKGVLLGIIALAASCATADTRFEQPVPPGSVWTELHGLTEGQKVSGTKVEFSLEFGHTPKTDGNPVPPAQWSHARLRSVSLKIGGWQVLSIAGPAWLSSYSYRFASTEFPHAQAIPIRARLRLEPVRMRPGDPKRAG